MALLEILLAPHPMLAKTARPVREDEFGPDLRKHMADMLETMYAAPGVGLAGPQVSDLRCLLVVDLPEEDEDGESEKGIVALCICNPQVVETSREKIRWEEGCLSVPEFWEYFERPRWVEIRYRTPLGETVVQRFEDYHAVIVQHEMDHLKGVIILEKVSRLKRSRYLRKVKKERKRAEAEAALG
jgi:peptide deformylase